MLSCLLYADLAVKRTVSVRNFVGRDKQHQRRRLLDAGQDNMKIHYYDITKLVSGGGRGLRLAHQANALSLKSWIRFSYDGIFRQ